MVIFSSTTGQAHPRGMWRHSPSGKDMGQEGPGAREAERCAICESGATV